MISAALLIAAMQATPSPAPVPTHAVALGGGLRAYLGCVRVQAGLWASDPNPSAHVDAVMAACAPSLPAAAADMANAIAADPAQAKVLAAYRAKHGTDLDLKPALEQRLSDQARAAALQMLSGQPGQATGSLSIHFDADGIKP